MSLIVSDWFENQVKWKVQPLIIEGVTFEIMMLNDKQISDVIACTDYDSMLSLAANYGIASNGERIVDDEEYSPYIESLWGSKRLKIDTDPCVKYRVGEKIAEISGLSDTLLERLEADKQISIAIDGDNLGDTDVTLEQLAEDAAVAAAA